MVTVVKLDVRGIFVKRGGIKLKSVFSVFVVLMVLVFELFDSRSVCTEEMKRDCVRLIVDIIFIFVKIDLILILR